MKIMIIALALVLGACTKEGTPTGNKPFNVQKLFDENGCTVYRFEDGLYDHYFTDCSGSVSSRRTCGKGCTRDEEIPTYRPRGSAT